MKRLREYMLGEMNLSAGNNRGVKEMITGCRTKFIVCHRIGKHGVSAAEDTSPRSLRYCPFSRERASERDARKQLMQPIGV